MIDEGLYDIFEGLPLFGEQERDLKTGRWLQIGGDSGECIVLIVTHIEILMHHRYDLLCSILAGEILMVDVLFRELCKPRTGEEDGVEIIGDVHRVDMVEDLRNHSERLLVAPCIDGLQGFR